MDGPVEAEEGGSGVDDKHHQQVNRRLVHKQHVLRGPQIGLPKTPQQKQINIFDALPRWDFSGKICK